MEPTLISCKRYAVSRATAFTKVSPQHEEVALRALSESMGVSVSINEKKFREKLTVAGINPVDIDSYINSLSIDDETYLQDSPQW